MLKFDRKLLKFIEKSMKISEKLGTESINPSKYKHKFAVMLSSRALARLDNITAVQKQKTGIQMGNVKEEVVEGGRWVKKIAASVGINIRSEM